MALFQKTISNEEALLKQTNLLANVMRLTLQKRAHIELSQPPEIRQVAIVEFLKRMRLWSLDKFKDTSYISIIQFYLDENEKKKNKSLGALIIYLESSYIGYLFKRLGYPNLDEDDMDVLKDACGTFCNIIAGLFRTALVDLGYVELDMSHFSCYVDSVPTIEKIPSGVDYHPTQTHKYEINFEILGVKRIVADLTLGPVPFREDFGPEAS